MAKKKIFFLSNVSPLIMAIFMYVVFFSIAKSLFLPIFFLVIIPLIMAGILGFGWKFVLEDNFSKKDSSGKLFATMIIIGIIIIVFLILKYASKFI